MASLFSLPLDIQREIADEYLGSSTVALSECSRAAFLLVQDDIYERKVRSIIQCAEFVASMEVHQPGYTTNRFPKPYSYYFFKSLLTVQTPSNNMEKHALFLSEGELRVAALGRVLQSDKLSGFADHKYHIREFLKGHPFAREAVNHLLAFDCCSGDDLFLLEIAAANADFGLFSDLFLKLQQATSRFDKNKFRRLMSAQYVGSDTISHDLAPTNMERVLWEACKSQDLGIIRTLVQKRVNCNGVVARLVMDADLFGLMSLYKCDADMRCDAALYAVLGSGIGAVLSQAARLFDLGQAKAF